MEMAVEQAKARLRQRCGCTDNCLYRKNHCEYDMAIKAFDENEKLKELYKNERKKNYELKEKIKKSEQSIKEHNVEYSLKLVEIEKLKEEIRQKNIEISELDANKRDLVDRPNNRMSAVELLEWIKNTGYEIKMCIFGDYDIENILFGRLLTPQEIVDRITEYEKNKVDVSKTENNTGPAKEEHFCDDTKMIEWVFEAYDFGNNAYKKEFETEKEANDYVEMIVSKKIGVSHGRIRKLCRRKN